MSGSIADCTVLNNGVEMPWLGFGVLQIGEDAEVSHAVLHALRFGYRSIDTASVYGNERAVGSGPDLMEVCRDHDIQIEAWSPLMKGNVGKQQTIVELADRYGKTPAQIVLRWDLQHEVVAIPKSRRLERIAENGDIFDFELAQEHMRLLDALNEGKRFGPDPYDSDF